MCGVLCYPVHVGGRTVREVWWPHYKRVEALKGRGVASVVVEFAGVVVLQGLLAALLVVMVFP